MEGTQGTEGVRPELDHCPRILSLDGGGVRGLSSLLILRNIMEEIARRQGPGTAEARPCEYFDLIGGTGTGGLIAIMLGRLRMSIADCVDEFIDLSKNVFDVDQVQTGVVPIGDNQCRFDYQKLETAIKTLVEKKLRDANGIMADSTNSENVPTFVVATKGLHANGPPTLFRSYQCTGYNADKCTIWEAGRAASARPTFFKPIKIAIPPPGATFIDGGLTHNNPAELALSEAQRIWSTVKRFCLVSVGTGKSKAVKIVDTNSKQLRRLHSKMATLRVKLTTASRVAAGQKALAKIRDACLELASNSEHVHQQLLKISTSVDPEKRFPYHRFNVERDIHEIELQEWTQMEVVGAHTAAYMEEGEGESKRNHCVQDLMSPPPIQFIMPVSPLSPKHFLMVYERNPHFIGRDELLTLLGEKLRDTSAKKYNHRVAIYGMGGVGKTQLAIEYVYRNKAMYDSIFWISSADQAALLSGFQDIARVTQCVPNFDGANLNPHDVAKAVLSWLGAQHGWLLVLDNMDDIDVAVGYLPEMAKGGHTLITTRNPNHLTIPAEGLEIPILAEDAAIELLLLRSQVDGTDGNKSDAAEIVIELGCLALAIEQAAAFIRSSVHGIANYLTIYRKSRLKLLGRKLPKSHPYPNSVATSFLLSFNRVRDETNRGTQAISLLRLLAFLNPDGVLIDFLRSGSPGLDEPLRQIVEDEIAFHDALELLQRYSLVALSQKRDNIVIHRLVQAVTKAQLDETELRTFRENVIGVANIFPWVDDRLTMTDRIECRRLQSQVLEPVVEAAELHTETAINLLLNIGRFLFGDGKFRESERVFSLCVEVSTTMVSGDHDDTLKAMDWLARTFCEGGKLDQAAALEEKVMESSKRLLGEEHPATLICMGNLALIFNRQGKMDLAAAILERVVVSKKSLLGEESRGTLTSMSNLAAVFSDQGKFDRAAAIEEKVVESRKRLLGEEHRETLASMNNLAVMLRSLGRLDRAEALEERVLKGRKHDLGEEHPVTLIAMGKVAWSLRVQGKLSEAAALGEKVLVTTRRILGEEHPDTLTAMGNLALIFNKQGKLDQAAAMEEKVLDTRKWIAGEEHPSTLTAMNNLAFSYYELGRRQEAIELLQKAVDGSRNVLGEDHPRTRSCVAVRSC